MECDNCPLRLYNDKYNIKGFGTTIYNRMIVLPYVDRDSYKKYDLSFSKIYSKLEEAHQCVSLYGGSQLVDTHYITSIIKCKQTNKIIVDESIINMCKTHLFKEISDNNINICLLIGNASKTMIGKSIEEMIGKVLYCNNIYYFFNYNPFCELYDQSKYEVFKKELSKYLYAIEHKSLIGYNIITL